MEKPEEEEEPKPEEQPQSSLMAAGFLKLGDEDEEDED